MISEGQDSANHEASSDDGSKPCRICGENIKRVARKCVHCNSWQSPFGELSSAVTVALPMIVAILSLLITAIPVITTALTPKKSIMSAAFQANSNLYISAIVSNFGGRPGSINGAELYVPGPKGDWLIELDAVTDDKSGAVLIPPGGSELVRFHLSDVFAPLGGNRISSVGVPIPKSVYDSISSAEGDDKPCKLQYLYSNFDGTSVSSEQTILCSTLSTFIDAISFSS